MMRRLERCRSEGLQSLKTCTLKPESPTYSLHCSSYFGLPYRILTIIMVKPKKGTTMETIGKTLNLDYAFRFTQRPQSSSFLGFGFIFRSLL